MLLMSSAESFAQGIQFTEGSWATILKKAKAEKRLVFIDIYTSWCGPCKKMARESFPQKEVGDFYNTNFVCYRLDAEKGEGVAVAKKYEITAYPTCLFVTGDGEVAYRFMGAKDTKELVKEGEKAVKSFKVLPKLNALTAQYKAGKRDKDFLKEYSDLLMDLGEKPGAALTQYYDQLTDAELFTKPNMKNFNNVTFYDKPLFDRMQSYYHNAPDTLKKKLERPIMRAIGGCLTPLLDGRKENAATFESLLSVKESMGVKSSVISVIFAGSAAYLPTDEMRISFYQTADPAKFKVLVPQFMEKTVKLASADSLYQESLAYRKKTIGQADSLRALHDSTGVNKAINSYSMSQAMMALGFQNDASFILSTTQGYWDMSDKSADVKAKCLQWGEYGCKICYTLEMAEKYASLLSSLGEKAEAKKVLSDAISFAKTDPTGKTDTAAIGKAEEQLKNL